MTAVWRYHSLRTWQFAAALAAKDHSVIDGELLYVAALLHDSGLFLTPGEGESFASAGARLARDTAGAAGVDPAAAELSTLGLLAGGFAGGKPVDYHVLLATVERFVKAAPPAP